MISGLISRLSLSAITSKYQRMPTQYNFLHLTHTHIKVFFSVFVCFLILPEKNVSLFSKSGIRFFSNKVKKNV